MNPRPVFSEEDRHHCQDDQEFSFFGGTYYFLGLGVRLLLREQGVHACYANASGGQLEFYIFSHTKYTKNHQI